MRFFISFLILFMAASFGLFAEDNYVPNQFILRLAPEADMQDLIEDVNAAEWGIQIQTNKALVKSLNIWLIDFQSDLSDQAVLDQVWTHPSVHVIQFNHTGLTRRVTIPNDPQFGDMWGLNNTGQTGGTNDADIDAIEAWDVTTGGTTADGDEIVVAVVDGGFELTHSDLDYWENGDEIPNNGVDDDGNGYVDDYNGWNAYGSNGNIGNDTHGTHVAGTVGARGNNSLGVTGVNWNVKIMAIQGSTSSESVALEAYGFAYNQRLEYNNTNGASGAFVVSTNASFGVDLANPASYPLWCGFYDDLGSVGILSAGATANANYNVDVDGDVPTGCSSNHLIAVTNTTHNDNKANGAGFGSTTIDLGAPGSNVLSTYTSNGYTTLSGTSMATPHVAGAVALLYAAGCQDFIDAYKANPSAVALQVKQYIMDGTDNIGIQTVTGGRLNVNNSIQLLIDAYCSNIPPTPAIAASSISACPGTTIDFTDNSTNSPTAWSWSFPGGSPSTSNAQNPSITYSTAGVYNVSLTVTNVHGSNTQTFNNYINIDATADQIVFYEDFESGAAGWTVDNPDDGITWALTGVGGNTPGSNAAYINHYNYNNAVGQKDRIYSPVIDLTQNANPYLELEYAHRRYSADYSDSLLVYISTNGGGNYTLLGGYAEDGTGSFATGTFTTNNFIPSSADDWCFSGAAPSFGCLSFDLSPYQSSSSVRLMFESVNDYGNNTFIDNITVKGECVPLAPPVAKAKIMLEGCKVGSSMTTDLNAKGLIPNNQPFSVAPWNYSGSETASSIPTNAVDWALIELRTSPDENDIVGIAAGFILSDGTLADIDGSDGIELPGLDGSQSYYLVIRTRAHSPVMTTSAIAMNSQYDFTTSATTAYGSGQLKNVGGTYSVLAGDFYNDGIMNVADFNNYIIDPSAIDEYHNWDANKDGLVTVEDYNLYRANSSFIGVTEVRY